MKAKEAPEKIYLDKDESWHLTNPNGDSVEYTRTDAFIEKARKWFEECFMNVHKWEISTYEFENIQSMIDEFRKYMKGE